MTASLIPFPKPFRPHLVTPSEAFAALELSERIQRRVTEEQEERSRRIDSGAPVVVALAFGEGMK